MLSANLNVQVLFGAVYSLCVIGLNCKVIIMKWSLLLPLFISSLTLAEECFEAGVEYEKLSLDNNMNAQYMQKAQDFFLCAEKKGNTYAGYKAATFSDGGVAKKIDPVELERLYSNSASDGNSDAALVMSRIVCGEDQNVCVDPAAAKKWIMIAIKLNKCEAYNSLGYFYERGVDGSVNFRRAADCYRLSGLCGNKLGEINYKRIEVLVDFSRVDVCF